MTKEVLKLALEYVELVQDDRYNAEHIDREALVTAIKEALAQETPYEVGKKVAREGGGFYKLWGAVSHDSDLPEAQRGYEEALEHQEHGWTPERIAGMTRLKEAQDKKLAQPEQEYHSVNAVHKGQQCYVKTQTEQPKVRTGNCLRVGVCASEGHKIQPQRTWVGLTDEEMEDLWDRYAHMEMMRAIEAKLKAKNSL